MCVWGGGVEGALVYVAATALLLLLLLHLLHLVLLLFLDVFLLLPRL